MDVDNRISHIAVGADGSGTTFRRILEACRNRETEADVAVLFANKADIGAVTIARAWEIPVVVLSGTRDERDAQLTHALTETFAPIDLICLAGYLRLFPVNLVGQFRGRILNSHPAVDLERFGGKGMYGTHVTAAELDAGVTETGSTIHFVDEHYDTGAIITQSSVRVEPDDTAESLLARKLPIERKLYIRAIRQVLENGSIID